MFLVRLIDRVFDVFFSPRTLRQVEGLAIVLAVIGFLAHLAVIGFARWHGGVDLQWFSDSYLAALYTPFSFLLFYEVLLLVQALPESMSRSIAKQYEVVTLIVLRRVFKDIAKLDAAGAVDLGQPEVWNVFADMVGALIMFLIVMLFRRSLSPTTGSTSRAIDRFVAFKKAVALVLGVLVAILAVDSLYEWGVEMQHLALGQPVVLSDVNALFYEDFFGLLVLVDVLILIVSFGLTHDNTSQVFRNAGFVASTVLVRLSFGAPRLDSIVILVVAAAFGLAVQQLDRYSARIEGAPTPKPTPDTA